MFMNSSLKIARDKFTAEDDQAMCIVLYKLLKQDIDGATLPCGLKVWREVRSMGFFENHTEHSLATHMRRFIFPKFEFIAPSLPEEIESYLKKAYRRYIFPMNSEKSHSRKSLSLSNASTMAEDQLDGPEEEPLSGNEQPSNCGKAKSKRNSRNNSSTKNRLVVVIRNPKKKSRKSSKNVGLAAVSTAGESCSKINESSFFITESVKFDEGNDDILSTTNGVEHDVSSGFQISGAVDESPEAIGSLSVASRIDNMIKSLSRYEENTNASSGAHSPSSSGSKSPPKIVENFDVNCVPDVEAPWFNGNLENCEPERQIAFTTSTPKNLCCLPNLGAEFALPKPIVDENRSANEITKENLHRIYGLTPEEIENLLLTNENLLTNAKDALRVMEKLVTIEQLSRGYNVEIEQVIKLVKKFKRLDYVERELKKRIS